ncbi:hypothetical protein PR048_026029 [Dryococelus australis]|uniref:Uncharacterized protein n=1 Tax=Dryococelus australis TaxID=614101 RepID=A0ABQ9GK74_9NEOP|nr:hypothetical protein PR048_026029 [Dryococelus australis]
MKRLKFFEPKAADIRQLSVINYNRSPTSAGRERLNTLSSVVESVGAMQWVVRAPQPLTYSLVNNARRRGGTPAPSTYHSREWHTPAGHQPLFPPLYVQVVIAAHKTLSLHYLLPDTRASETLHCSVFVIQVFNCWRVCVGSTGCSHVLVDSVSVKGVPRLWIVAMDGNAAPKTSQHAVSCYSYLHGVGYTREDIFVGLIHQCQEIWAALNTEVLRVARGGGREREVSMEQRRNEMAGGGGGDGEIPEKTCRPMASSATVPTCEKSGSDPAGNLTRFLRGGRRVVKPQHHRGPDLYNDFLRSSRIFLTKEARKLVYLRFGSPKRHNCSTLSGSTAANLGLDSTVVCTLEPQMCAHWLLPHRVASVTSHLAVWHSLIVSLQVCCWLIVVQGVSNKLRSNCKVNFSVHGANPLRLLGRKIMQGDMHRGKEGLGSHGLHFWAMTISNDKGDPVMLFKYAIAAKRKALCELECSVYARAA